MCQKDIELCVKSMLTNIGSIVNMIREDLYDHLMSMRIFNFIMDKIFL